jgi:hypothetical protein
MYAFGRRVRLNGVNIRAALALATQITEKVVQITGTQTNLYTKAYSPGVGTLLWTANHPDLSSMEAATDKLNVDNSFQDLVEQAQQYVIPGTMDDTISTFVYPTEITMTGESQPAYVSTTTATIAPGHMADGIAVGVEIAQLYEELVGSPLIFLVSSTGNMGGVTWAGLYQDAAQMQRAEEIFNTNPRVLELIDKRAAEVFSGRPGEVVAEVWRRLV